MQRKIGASNAWGFDLNAACSGFVYGLWVAAKLVEAGGARNVMLCGADKMSAIINFEDRATCVLFGDGAGVVFLEPTDDETLGVQDAIIRMDGEGGRYLYMPAGEVCVHLPMRLLQTKNTLSSKMDKLCSRPLLSGWPMLQLQSWSEIISVLRT